MIVCDLNPRQQRFRGKHIISHQKNEMMKEERERERERESKRANEQDSGIICFFSIYINTLDPRLPSKADLPCALLLICELGS